MQAVEGGSIWPAAVRRLTGGQCDAYLSNQLIRVQFLGSESKFLATRTQKALEQCGSFQGSSVSGQSASVGALGPAMS